MKTFKAILILVIFMMVSASAGKARIGNEHRIGVKARITEDLTIGYWAAFHFGEQMEQLRAWKVAYDSTGYSGYESMPWKIPLPSLELKLGTLAGAHFTGAAELVERHHFVEDDYLWDDSLDMNGNEVRVIKPSEHREMVPRLGIGLSLPLGSHLVFEFKNWFERRLLLIADDASESSPLNNQHQGMRWRPQLKLATAELTRVKLVPFIYYEGYNFKKQGEVKSEQFYIAEFSTGMQVEPVPGLELQLSERFLWKPQVAGSPLHIITADISYTFNLVKVSNWSKQK